METKYLELRRYVTQMEEQLTCLKSDFESRIPAWTRKLMKLDAFEETLPADLKKVWGCYIELLISVFSDGRKSK